MNPHQNDLLGSIDRELSISRIRDWHAKQKSDAFMDLRRLISGHEEYYPKIANWFDKQVTSGLISNRRIGYVGYLGDHPVAAAVLKIGKKSKFCHLSIDESVQNLNIGNLFFSLMALEVRKDTEFLHFTLPEHLWEQEKEFFQSYGFTHVVRANRQYRLFEEEFWSGQSYDNVYNRVFPKLAAFSDSLKIGGLSLNTDLLMPIKRPMADKVFEGTKTIEIRKGFSDRWEGTTATIIAPQPDSQVLGQVKIGRVYRGSPHWIWECFGSSIGCEKREFDFYSNGSESITAIRLEQPAQYHYPFPIEQLRHLTDSKLLVPQRYKKLDKKDDEWSIAIKLSVLMEGKMSRNRPTGGDSESKVGTNLIGVE